MKRHKIFPAGVCLSLILLALAACQPAAPTVTATLPPTLSATRAATTPPTTSPTATQILLPTPHPTHTRQPTVTLRPIQPTRTPTLPMTPLVTSLFYLPLEYPSGYQTSTPIFTPTNPEENYKLKIWSEEDSIALIKILDEYAHANDFCEFGCVRQNLVLTQKSVELTLQEIFWRYPQTASIEQFQWRMALARSIQGNHESDEWMLSILEKWLNEKSLSVRSLNDLVLPYGFTVKSPFLWDDEQSNTFFNLFGDQKDATVYRLTTQGSLSDGIFFAVHENIGGEQEIIPFFSHWNFNFADDGIRDVSDHNLNGIPEILFYVGGHSGSMCGGSVLVFEWQDDQFVQRIDGEIDVIDCTMSEWGYYDQPDKNGYEMLFIKNQEPSSAYTDFYQWNGNFYVFDKRDYDFKKADNIVYELHWAYTKPDKAIAILHKVLPAMQGQSSEYGPSFFDYLRFQLGLLYAVTGREDDAKVEFKNLVALPTNTSITVIPQAAQAFLAQYTDKTCLYHACNAALAVMETALNPFRDADGNVTEQQMIQAWGYDGAWPLYPLCNLDFVLPHITWQFNTNQMADVPTALREAGVTVEHSARLDLDDDGDQDWIEVVTKPHADRSDAIVWALLREPKGLLALAINGGDEIDRQSAQDTFAIQTVTPNTGNRLPIILVHSGSNLFAFQVLHSEKTGPYLKDVSDYWGKVTDYRFEDHPSGLKLFVTSPDGNGENVSVVERYYWDGEKNRFDFEESALAVFAERAAQSLWQEGKAAEAIPALQSIVSYPLPICPEGCILTLTNRSRYHYLLALAYELTGDETAAIQTYWQLWHDFPSSPYALMARAKLEPLKH